jgi:hypothetical protein
MREAVKCTAVVAAIILLCAPALAWSPESRARMTDEAVRFMPASLRLALESHRESLLRGVLTPMVGEDGPEHSPPWSGGSLDRQIESEAAALIELLGRRSSFREISERFGRVAHYVLDAGFPPAVSLDGPASHYGHFSEFCESRRERFPLVFYGHEDPDLDRGEFHAFALRTMRSAGSDNRLLASAYAMAGNPPNPAAFDDRSIPFAIGSLSYSRSINNVVRVWLAVWRQAGGDLGRTPYMKKKKKAVTEMTDGGHDGQPDTTSPGQRLR